MWKAFAGCLNTKLNTKNRKLSLIVTNCHTKRFLLVLNVKLSNQRAVTKLTFEGVAAEMECRGVKACIVCETPAANMNSSLSSVLVLPRALFLRKKTNIFRFVVESVVLITNSRVKHIQATVYCQWGVANWLEYRKNHGKGRKFHKSKKK